MTYDLRYRSSRLEVWRSGWNAWRATFWRAQLPIAVIVPAVTLGRKLTVSSYLACACMLLLGIFLLVYALIPQLMFKSDERELHVGPEGWSTRIGKQSASRQWSEVASIQEVADTVVIWGTNGNALVVPSRAFTDRASLRQFAIDAQAWRNALHVG